jgi:putative CocE/NonD family hydrolase
MNRDKRLFLSALLILVASCGRAQTAYDVRAHYAKTEPMIAMRDGVKLHTVVFTPRDAARTYPIMLIRTPYGVPTGPDNFPRRLGPSDLYAPAGYIVAYQDVRGKGGSEGDYVNVRPQLRPGHGPRNIDESTDTYDTIDWLIHNVPHNNGRVGMWGISYPGFYAAAGAINAHQALKAVSPQAPIADWFLGDDDHHNGAFLLMDNFAWDFDGPFDYPRNAADDQLPPRGQRYDVDDAYRFYLNLGPLKNANARYFKSKVPFWNDLIAHSNYDQFWQERSLLPYFRNIKPAMLIVGGWFDAEDFYGPLHIYKEIARASAATANYLVIGPWQHGGWEGPGSAMGDIPFGASTGETFRNEIEFPFFEHYLKDVGAPPKARAQIFLTGANRWETFDAWPPRDVKPQSLYLHAGKELDFTRPENGAAGAYDEYVSDPANPVPYAPFSGVHRDNRYVIADQRFVAGRADVLTFQTAPLDRDLTVLGPVTADLYVSTTGTDSDWVVKIIDVYPDDASPGESASGNVKMADYQMLVRADVMRGKFRNSFVKPEPFTPDKVTQVKFDLPDVGHMFRKGHRLMVQIQSSWFPLVDRNPQTFCDISAADEADFHAATQRIYHTPQYPSQIILRTRQR